MTLRVTRMGIRLNRKYQGQIATQVLALGEFHFSVMYGREAFDRLKDAWCQIVGKDPLASPYLHWGSAKAWLENMVPSAEVVVVTVQRDGQIQAIIPFFAREREGFMGEKRLQMVGFETMGKCPSLSEEPIYAMSLDDDQAEILWVQLAEYLHTVLKVGTWDSIAYRRWVQLMDRPAWSRRRDQIVEVREYLRGSEIVELPETWDLYKKQLSKSMRENLPYYPRKVEKDGLTWRIEISERNQIDRYVDILKKLHHQRVEEDPTGGHRDYMLHPNKHGYLSDLCKGGEGFVAKLYIGDEVVASQLFMRKQDCLLVLHSGFQLSYNKYSPLFILQSYIFRQAIESGVRRLNLLPGNAQWQNRWTARATHSVENVTIASKRPVARVRQLVTTVQCRIIRR
jgi:CelD/BcsL family acetyltransferase involved in cellulose biosynthesis